MNYIVFIYNVLLIVLFAMNIALFCTLFIRVQKAAYVWIAAMFTLFVAENSILYMADFLESFSIFYNMHTVTEPFLKTLISAGVYLCYLFIATGLTRQKVSSRDWAAYALFAAALILVPHLPKSRFTYWLYFTLSQIMFCYVAARGYSGAKRLPEDSDEQKIYRNRLLRMVRVSMFLNILIVVEDSIVIFFFDDLTPEALRITQRNWSEDVQSIYFALLGISYFYRKLLHAPAVPEGGGSINVLRQASEELKKKQIEQVCACHGLTGRESEVLALLLSNKTNKDIGSELFISVGTVKNHIHNIYQKTGAAGRTQLLSMITHTVVEEAAEREASA